MNQQPTFWTAVRLLLRAAYKRSAGRQKRQQELLNNRSGKAATDWGSVATLFTAIFMIGINVAAAFLVRTAVTSAQRVEAAHHIEAEQRDEAKHGVEARSRVEAEQPGKILVSRTFLNTSA